MSAVRMRRGVRTAVLVAALLLGLLGMHAGLGAHAMAGAMHPVAGLRPAGPPGPRAGLAVRDAQSPPAAPCAGDGTGPAHAGASCTPRLPTDATVLPVAVRSGHYSLLADPGPSRGLRALPDMQAGSSHRRTPEVLRI